MCWRAAVASSAARTATHARAHALVRRLTLTCVLTALPAFAQREASERDRARELAYAGVTALQSGDAERATEQLERAYAVLRVPSVALWSARALASSGDLLAAQQRLREALSLSPTEGDIEVQRAAQRDAAQELEAVERRTPRVAIRAPRGTSYSLTLDDVAVELPRRDLALNPGLHVLEAESDGVRYRLAFVLVEGKRQIAHLPLRHIAPKSALGRTGRTSAAPAADCAGPGCGPSPVRVWGFVALGAGAAAFLGAGVAAIFAARDLERIHDDPRCNRDRCSSDARGLVESYGRARTLSSVAWVSGGVLTGAGATLLLWPGSPQRSTLSLTPWGLRLHGHF